MKNKLPDMGQTVENISAKVEAIDAVDGLITRNFELEDIFEEIQPLLYSLSVKLYGEDSSDVSLSKLVYDAVTWIDSQKEIL